MITRQTIDAIALFAGLNTDARRTLAELGFLRRIAEGAVLWRAGESPSGLHVLLEGEVRVVRVVGGRQHVLHTEGPGGTLGDLPLFDGSPSPATAIAVLPAVCAVFSREALARAIAADPRLAFLLLGRLAHRLRHVINRLDGASARTVTQRLSLHLLQRSDEAGQAAFALGRTQTQVAEELGTVREVVVRGLRELRQAGLITTAGRGRFRVVDATKLRQVARGPED